MKTFLDLLATEMTLCVVCNEQSKDIPLLQPLRFQSTDIVTIDGIEVLPKFQHLACDGVLNIDEPFYRWLHHATGQGWLLTPQM